MAKVLVVDDEPYIGKLMAKILTPQQHEVAIAVNLAEGLQLAETIPFDVIFLDIYLPDGSGLDMVPLLTQTPSRPDIIIFSGQGTPAAAEIAIKNGAWDYLQKPISLDEVALAMKRVLLYRASKLSASVAPPLKRHGIVGSSPQISKCRSALAKAAQSDANVLITGDTGTGKELFAKAIHVNSARAAKNFVVVDCAALPENLIDSTLFGHERGAFTGADRAKMGLVKQADGGTLFLDEIGELPLSFQKTFLRVIQEHHWRPVGSDREISSDFRLVAATNRDLDAMVAQGLFRQDLLFRIRAVAIELPPLKDRHEDIGELAHYYCERLCQKYGLQPKQFAPDGLEALLAYHWPGNVRELVNVMDATINAAYYEEMLFAKHLPHHLRITVKKSSLQSGEQHDLQETQEHSPQPVMEESPDALHDDNGQLLAYRQFRENLLAAGERQYLTALFSTPQMTIKQACAISGLGRTRLYTLMKKHGISKDSV